jgi:hypothetical protein
MAQLLAFPTRFGVKPRYKLWIGRSLATRDLRIPKALTGVEEVLRWTAKVRNRGEKARDGSTLKSGFDHIEGMDGESGACASGKAGHGLDQRGRETRMVVVHRGGISLIML